MMNDTMNMMGKMHWGMAVIGVLITILLIQRKDHRPD
jgi:hypothetical protein